MGNFGFYPSLFAVRQRIENRRFMTKTPPQLVYKSFEKIILVFSYILKGESHPKKKKRNLRIWIRLLKGLLQGLQGSSELIETLAGLLQGLDCRWW